MNIFDIRFKHFQPLTHKRAAKNFVQFTIFATLCKINNVANHVRWVSFHAKNNTFEIDVCETLRGAGIVSVIADCAKQSLGRSLLFGQMICKKELSKTSKVR